MIYAATMRATAEVVPAPLPGPPTTLTEETETLLRWLEGPGVRIVELEGHWTCPVGGAGSVRHELEPALAAAADALAEVVGFDGQRGSRPGRPHVPRAGSPVGSKRRHVVAPGSPAPRPSAPAAEGTREPVRLRS